MAKAWLVLFVGLFLLHQQHASAFYLPGVAPKEFRLGDRVEIKSVKMTSVKRPLPYEYYFLPFCRPKKKKHARLNLGEVLRGDRITNTPYELQMAVNKTCVKLCKDKKGDTIVKEYTKEQVRKFEQFIRARYRVHWLMDNLPSATKLSLSDGSHRYSHGFPLGYVEPESHKVYLFNHVIIIGKVHLVSDETLPESERAYRIVGFEVKTRSIGSDRYSDSKKTPGDCEVVTSKESKTGALVLNHKEMQDGQKLKVQWSYSVSWEPSEIAWASRWDTYLKMDDADIHWVSILNSSITVVLLSCVVAFIMWRILSRDIQRYNEGDDSDLFEQRGWKLVHGDVFRAPEHSFLLTTFLGSGIQLLCMIFVTLVFSMFGMLSPAIRGGLMTTAIVCYMVCGVFSGYFSSRMNKGLETGVTWWKAALVTGSLFPLLAFGVGFILNFFVWYHGSSGAVPFGTMLALLVLWSCVALSCVMCGAFFGHRKAAYEFPVPVNQIPRQIPEQACYNSTFISIVFGGMFPFSAVFVELFFILTAIWENQFYYLFGFLFLVFVILLIACSEIAIVMVYLQLAGEDYHWWWRSYLASGSIAFYVFAYAIYYFYKLGIQDFEAALLYFGYSFVMALAFWFATGTIGFYAALTFVRKIYTSVKID